MRDDAPAALPLIAFALGLALPLVNPWTAVIGLLAIATLYVATGFSPSQGGLKPAPTSFLVFFAIGVLIAVHESRTREQEASAFAAFEPDRFVAVTAPIERDWSSRSAANVLIASRFVANGVPFDRTLLIYIRSTPPRIDDEKRIRVRGFLRLSEHGLYTITAKAPLLISYEGHLSAFDPALWNRRLTRRVERYSTAFPTEVALVEAVALGRSERLHDDVRDDFKRGGTYHLLVFSGLQIALAAAAMAFVLRWIGAPRVSDISLLAFSIVAPLFAGPTASVSRAAVAIGLYAISRLLRRPTSLENLWALSALVRLIFVPAELTDAAFHLTYAGAGALLFLARRGSRRVRWIGGAAAAEIAVTPLTLFHFHQYAIGGSLTTIAMMPLIFGMLIASVVAIAFPCAATFLAIRAIHIACMALNSIGAHTSGFFAAPTVVAMAIGFGGAVTAIAIARMHRRALIVVALLVPSADAITRHLARRTVAVPEITFLDVGQGDSILVRDGPHTLLVDGGGRADDERFGESTLLPMLVDRGVQHIDAIALSHVHPDHCGGLPPVIRRLEVAEVWISPRQFRGLCAQQILDAALDRHVDIHLAREGEHRWIGSLRITAHAAAQTFRRASENNSSLVLQIRSARLTALLTGDIEREAEAELLQRLGRADLLKVAHHGSRSSTTEPFLAAVQPRIAVISCGRNNLFGHPHPLVIAALRERHIAIRRTDLNGSVRVAFGGGRLAASSEIDTVSPGATVTSSYVVHPTPPRPLDDGARPRRMGHPAEFRGGRDHGVPGGGHASEGAPRQHRSDHRRHRVPRVREGREESREESLQSVPDADPARRDLLPRASAQRSASGRRADARDAHAVKPLIVIAGPTGSGKSDLALRLAEAVGGEIVNYDSIQVYRGFDIGSAKPPLETRVRVPHHLFDVVDATDEFNAADYAARAREVCASIDARGHRAILAGGTFFYLRALLAGLPEMPPKDEEIRSRLRAIASRPRGQALLHRWLSKIDPQSGRKIAPADRHRVERALEVWVSSGKPISTWEAPRFTSTDALPSIKLALRLEREQLARVLDARVESMYANGLIEETRALLQTYPRTARPFTAIGYAEAAAVVAGEMNEAEAIAQTRRRTRAYAKRQMTWLRSERNVHWIEARERDDTFAEAMRIVQGGK